MQGNNGRWYAPEGDPYYNPAGFDFGGAIPEAQTTTGWDGSQTLDQNQYYYDNPNTNINSGGGFPRTGTTTNSTKNLNIRSGPRNWV